MVARALNAKLDDHLGYDKHKALFSLAAEAARPVRPYVPEMASFNWIPPEAVKADSSLNLSKITKHVLRPWTAKYDFCTLKA